MKVKINCHKNDHNTKLCALMGCFDETGRYCEVGIDDVRLGDLPQCEIKKVREGHDVLIRILPKTDIIVFARSADDLIDYLETMGANHVKDLLVAMSKYNNPEDGSLWTTYDFPAEI